MTPNIFTNNFWIISSIYILATFIKASLLIHIVDKYSFTSVSFLLMSEPLADSIHEIIEFINKDEKNALTTIILRLLYINFPNFKLQKFYFLCWCDKFKASAEIILFLLLILITLIYDEIIVIKIYGLDKDIQEAIKKRGDDDITLVQKTTLELD